MHAHTRMHTHKCREQSDMMLQATHDLATVRTKAEGSKSEEHSSHPTSKQGEEAPPRFRPQRSLSQNVS